MTHGQGVRTSEHLGRQRGGPGRLGRGITGRTPPGTDAKRPGGVLLLPGGGADCKAQSGIVADDERFRLAPLARRGGG
jgi:hypothetical protein